MNIPHLPLDKKNKKQFFVLICFVFFKATSLQIAGKKYL